MDFSAHNDTAYLLGASLSSLHEQSTGWTHEIEFWQGEMAFLYKLLNQRFPSSYPPERLAALEKELVKIQTAFLDSTKKEILNHEKTLASMMYNSSSIDEEKFRDQHHRLAKEIYSIHNMIKNFKNEVFALF